VALPPVSFNTYFPKLTVYLLLISPRHSTLSLSFTF
jgi:hypothetical protein